MTEGALRTDRSTLLNGATWSPRVATQLVHSAWTTGTVSLGLSYGAGFAPPTLADQFFQEGVQVRANPALRPERTRHDGEARLTLRDVPRFGAIWHAELAAYRADVEGMILWLPDFRFIWSPNNYNAERRGWEMRGGVRIPRANLDLRGGLDASHVTYAGGLLTGQVAYRPRHTGHLQVGGGLGAARAEVVLRHVGVRRVAAGSALNALPAYRMTDVRFSTDVRRGRWAMQPAITVENLFSRQAAMLVDYPFPTRLWSLVLRVRPQSSSLP
jgi:outer membrane cobalamin receptor